MFSKIQLKAICIALFLVAACCKFAQASQPRVTDVAPPQGVQILTPKPIFRMMQCFLLGGFFSSVISLLIHPRGNRLTLAAAASYAKYGYMAGIVLGAIVERIPLIKMFATIGTIGVFAIFAIASFLRQRKLDINGILIAGLSGGLIGFGGAGLIGILFRILEEVYDPLLSYLIIRDILGTK